MKNALTTISLALSLVSFTLASSEFYLWPIPQSVQLGNTDLDLDSSFKINAPEDMVLNDAIDRYTKIITGERWIPVQESAMTQGVQNATETPQTDQGSLESLDITIDDMKADLAFGVNETYTINIPASGKATLNAATVWGALRGLETFSQLVLGKTTSDGPDDDFISVALDLEFPGTSKELLGDKGFEGLYIPNTPIQIQDSPRFAHRGLLLDTSRNYYTVRDIIRTIDAMAYNKMNVFHWHITDSHSFPIRLDEVPELAQKGSYKLQGKRLIYSKQDVRRIVKHARYRGVRVIPEIDMPAHTGSWAAAFKEITTCTDKFYLDKSNAWDARYAAEPGSGQLNPVKNETYAIVQRVIRSVTKLFPDAFYHGGGDEPISKCWEDDSTVRDYMSLNNATSDDLLQRFILNELGMVKEANKTALLWEDPVTTSNLDIPKDVILQVWNNPVQKAVQKGHKVIASDAQFWYLDCGHGGWAGNDSSYDEQQRPAIPDDVQQVLDKYGLAGNYNPPNWGGSGGDWCSPFKSWQRVYSYDPTFNLTKEESQNVLGGEVALWSEQADSTVLDSKLWPRSAAGAEVMWSGRYDQNNTKRDIGDAMPRIFDWRYRLLKRGVRAEPLQPLWCGQNPHMCDATYPAAFMDQMGSN